MTAADDQRAVAERDARAGDAWEGSLIEGLAQTAAALDARQRGEATPALLVGLRDLVLSRRPRVGERITYRATLLRRLPPLVLVEGEATGDGGEVLARGELKFYVETP